jgi:antitoxin FitA
MTKFMTKFMVKFMTKSTNDQFSLGFKDRARTQTQPTLTSVAVSTQPRYAGLHAVISMKPNAAHNACKPMQCMQPGFNGAIKMAMLTVRNVSDEVHRALRARAARHGHSMETEVREILQTAVSPQGRVKLGLLLADMGRRAKLSGGEFAVFDQVRSKAPARPPSFE